MWGISFSIDILYKEFLYTDYDTPSELFDGALFPPFPRYTQNTEKMSVYAIFLKWPTNYNLELGSIHPTYTTEVTLLGYPTPLKWTYHSPTILVQLPSLPLDSPLQWAWALKFHETSFP